MIPFPFQTRVKNADSPAGRVRGLGLLVVRCASTGLAAEDVLFTQNYRHRIPCPRQVPLMWKCLKPLQHWFVFLFLEDKIEREMDHSAGAMIKKPLEMHLHL